jgi:hypothetical protein
MKNLKGADKERLLSCLSLLNKEIWKHTGTAVSMDGFGT